MTNHPSRAELAWKYFIPMPVVPESVHVKLAIGGISVAAGLGLSIWQGFLGLLAIAGGLTLLVIAAVDYQAHREQLREAIPRANDWQMDQWLREGLEPIEARARHRLNIHPTELNLSMPLQYLRFISPAAAGGLRWVIGRDGRLRFSAYRVLVLYLSTDRLPIYECVLDMVTGVTYTDMTQEYSLNKVDGLQTRSDRVNISAPPAPGYPSPTPAFSYTMQQHISISVAGRAVVNLPIGVAAHESVQVESFLPFQDLCPVDTMIAMLREHLRASRAGDRGYMSARDSFGPGAPQLGLPFLPPGHPGPGQQSRGIPPRRGLGD